MYVREREREREAAHFVSGFMLCSLKSALRFPKGRRYKNLPRDVIVTWSSVILLRSGGGVGGGVLLPTPSSNTHLLRAHTHRYIYIYTHTHIYIYIPRKASAENLGTFMPKCGFSLIFYQFSFIYIYI